MSADTRTLAGRDGTTEEVSELVTDTVDVVTDDPTTPEDPATTDAVARTNGVGPDRAGAPSAQAVDVGASDPSGARAVRIESGNPTDEDVAVVVAVLSAAAAGAAPVEDPRPPENWGDPTHLHRTFSPFSPYAFTANPTGLFSPR